MSDLECTQQTYGDNLNVRQVVACPSFIQPGWPSQAVVQFKSVTPGMHLAQLKMLLLTREMGSA